MKAITASVSWNSLASLLAIVLFGVLFIEGVGPRQNGGAVCPLGQDKFLSADGPTPIPQWPLPPPKAIA